MSQVNLNSSSEKGKEKVQQFRRDDVMKPEHADIQEATDQHHHSNNDLVNSEAGVPVTLSTLHERVLINDHKQQV